MEFKHTKIVENPCWPNARYQYMVLNITLPFVPPYFGTKKMCAKAQVCAEESSLKYLKEHGYEEETDK